MENVFFVDDENDGIAMRWRSYDMVCKEQGEKNVCVCEWMRSLLRRNIKQITIILNVHWMKTKVQINDTSTTPSGKKEQTAQETKWDSDTTKGEKNGIACDWRLRI